MYVLLLSLFSAGLLAGPAHDGGNPTRTSKAPRILHLGRCTGSAGCTACTNCSRCAHCGSGGTCGVCASPVSYTPKRSYSSSRSSSSRSRSGAGGSSRSYVAPARPKVVLKVEEAYYINASTLNLRAEPSADAEVVAVLNRNDLVRVEELTNEKWAKVTVVGSHANRASGYVSRAYLAEDSTY